MLGQALASLADLESEVVFGRFRTRLGKLLKDAQSIRYPAAQSVALSLSNPVQLITHLVALDGRVEALVMVSPDCSSQEINRRVQLFEDCVLVRDNRPVLGSSAQTACKGTTASLADGCETRWVLATSGTTASPKLVAHTFQSLTRTTRTGGGSEMVWGVLYDPYRYAGLQVILQGLLGGSTLVFADQSLSVHEQLSYLASERVNALSATPTLWRKILMSDNHRLLDLRSISLGGEIADDPILRSLAHAYPNARIRHIYASTEAGTAFSVSDGLSGFPSSYLAEAPFGVALKIEHHTLHIKNTAVCRHYMDDKVPFADKQGYVNTGDQVVVKGDRVYFLGRLSGVINVGGNKVFPEHVESTLLTVPDISQARVYGEPNPIVGQLVVADVVTAGNGDIEDTRTRLQQTATAALKPYERPTHYRFVDEVRQSPAGKVLR